MADRGWRLSASTAAMIGFGATLPLQAAAEKAVNENPESRAVGVVPELRDGRPVAAVKLLRRKDLVTVLEPLN